MSGLGWGDWPYGGCSDCNGLEGDCLRCNGTGYLPEPEPEPVADPGLIGGTR